MNNVIIKENGIGYQIIIDGVELDHVESYELVKTNAIRPGTVMLCLKMLVNSVIKQD